MNWLASQWPAGWLHGIFVGPLTEFEFMRHALLACLALSLSAAPMGVFLMLRRMSLTGDAMAHAVLPGAAVGYLVAGFSLMAMTLGGTLAGLVVALGSGAVSRRSVLREDTSLAAFYLLSLALGVFLVSTQGSNVDLLHVLFGSVLGLNTEAIALLGGITATTLLTLGILFRPLVLECLDTDFLKQVSRMSPVAHGGFLVLLVINLVAGFHALGTLMAVGLMVLPAAIARCWSTRLAPMLVAATLLAALASASGLLMSYHQDWPTSPVIVLNLGAIYLISLLIAPHGAMRHHPAALSPLSN